MGARIMYARHYTDSFDFMVGGIPPLSPKFFLQISFSISYLFHSLSLYLFQSVLCRENSLGMDGSRAMLEAAERLGASIVGNVLEAAWYSVWRGALRTLDLIGTWNADLSVACVTRYLGRSASCLTSINMRRARRCSQSLFLNGWEC